MCTIQKNKPNSDTFRSASSSPLRNQLLTFSYNLLLILLAQLSLLFCRDLTFTHIFFPHSLQNSVIAYFRFCLSMCPHRFMIDISFTAVAFQYLSFPHSIFFCSSKSMTLPLKDRLLRSYHTVP